MKKILTALFVVMAGLVLLACPTPLEEPKLGAFAAQALTPTSRAVEFSVGTVKASDAFYFILKNVGTAPISNISISSNDTKFVVTPGTISVLDTEANTSITPLIRVAINHGTVLGEVGFSDLISSGSHTTRVTISGDSEGTPVTLDVDLLTLVQSANWELTSLNSAGTPVTLNPTIDNGSGFTVYNFSSLIVQQVSHEEEVPEDVENGIPAHTITVIDVPAYTPSTFIFKNSGQVPLVFYWQNNTNNPSVGTTKETGTTVLPGEEVMMNLQSTYFYVFTSNAVIDQNIYGSLRGSTVQMGFQ